MPTYDYLCEANQRVYEVRHSMSTLLSTWEELCAACGIDYGDVAPDTKVTRLIGGSGVVKSSSLKNPDAPPSMSEGGCRGGYCSV